MSPIGVVDVVELRDTHEGKYSNFVRQQPRSMVYTTLEFRAFLRRCVAGTPRYLVAMRDGEVVGAFPAFTTHHEQWGTVLNSLPWYGSHGGCVVAEGDDAARVALLEHAADLLLAPEVAFSTVILTHDESARLDQYRRALAPRVTDYRLGQITELPEAGAGLEDRLAQLLRQKTRNQVRKSLRQSFTVDVVDDDEGWAFLYDTHVQNITAIGGRAKPRAHFDALRETIPAEWRRLLVTRHDDRPVAALLLLRYNRTVEYFTPVIRHEFRSMQPLSFTIWHAMLDAVRCGFRWWNWGGTWATQVSLHHFKAGWGAVERPYTYLIRATDQALRGIERDRDSIVQAFPYYFIYPFSPVPAP